VSSEKDINLAVLKAVETYGFLNASVNCAGINVMQPTLSDTEDVHSLQLFEDALKIISPLPYLFHLGHIYLTLMFNFLLQINAVGSFNVARLVAKAMSKNVPNEGGERGVIVNVSSIHGYEGQASKVAYSAAKGAIIAMTLPLARDLAKFGIRVMCIAPGLFETPMLVKARPDPIARAAVTKSVPFPSRAGDPDEFAQLVQSVIENPMLNGEVIRIDGAVRLA
ncbi:hypothetical protein QZH41_016584, partial [Actinostola sp. cb2023]